MSIDPNRWALIIAEWRTAIYADAAVLSLYPEARDITLDSALDSGTAADTFCSNLFDILKVARRRYEVVVRGATTWLMSNWQSAPPTVTLKSSRYGIPSGLLGVVVGAKWNFNENILTLEVWG